MADPRYTHFLTALCDYAQTVDSGHILQAEQFFIDDVGFTFSHDPDSNPDRVLICCEFGKIADDVDATGFIDLLKYNTLIYSGSHSPSFACLPGTSQVMLIFHASVDDEHPGQLLSTLQVYASQAIQWREGAWRFPDTNTLMSRLNALAMDVIPGTAPDDLPTLTIRFEECHL